MRPNIVLIYVDDMGSELGCYGDPVARTPNIDRIASEGIRFTRAYTATPSCSPSRAALLTGRYPHTNGVLSLIQWHRHHEGPNYPFRIERTKQHALKHSETIIPQTLKALGYATGIFGKWHVSLDPVTDWGFDEVFADPEEFIAARAADKDQPFFYYHTLVHTHEPFWSSPDFPYDPQELPLPPYFDGLGDNPGNDDSENDGIAELRRDLADYYSAISNQDREVGRILDALDRAGVADNTIVVFASDNGPPYARAKATLYEWGIRIPLIIRFPSVLTESKVTDAFASTVDIYPTLLDVLGETIPDRLEGTSLWPDLTGAAEGPDAVFSELNCHVFFNPMRSVRVGHWKYIRNFDPRAPFFTGVEKLGLRLLKHPLPSPPRVEEELYDLENDPLEGLNLAAEPRFAGKLVQMRGRLQQWMQRTADDPAADLATVTWEETYPGGWFNRPEDPAPNTRPETEISRLERSFDTLKRLYGWIAGVP